MSSCHRCHHRCHHCHNHNNRVFNNVGARRTYHRCCRRRCNDFADKTAVVLLAPRVYHNNNNDVSGRHTRNNPTNKQTNNKSSTTSPFSLCKRARACNNFGIGILNNNITRDLNNNSSSSCSVGKNPSPAHRAASRKYTRIHDDDDKNSRRVPTRR